MHILYIHQYFKTPEESGATRSYWLAKKLIDHGHRVTMITATNNLLHNEPQKCNIDGIDVVYLKNEYNQSFSKIKKIQSFSKFIFQSVFQSLKIKNVDLVFATSTPLSIGAVALSLFWIKKWKFVFEVRDLWPEFPIQIGAIKNKFIISILRNFEKTIYNKAEHIIALSPGMKEGVVSTGIPESKVSMIPNMSKPDLFFPRVRSNKFIKLLNLDIEKLNIIHFGSMGVANGLEYLIEVAKILQERKCQNICFYIVGKGSTLPLLQKMTHNYKLENVKFPGNFNLYDISEIVNCCDASFVSFKDLPILYTNSPNKLFDSLSAGKPIIVNSAGWTKSLVENNNCGYYVNPRDPSSFVDLLLSIDKKSEEFEMLGNKARLLSEKVFDKQILSEKFVDIIESVK